MQDPSVRPHGQGLDSCGVMKRGACLLEEEYERVGGLGLLGKGSYENVWFHLWIHV